MSNKQWRLIRTDILTTVLLDRGMDKEEIEKLFSDCDKERKRIFHEEEKI